VILLLAACAPEIVEEATWIEPLDGRTAVDPDAALRLHAASLSLPPGYPVGDFLRVVDLESGGFVPGEVIDEGDAVAFLPDEPWDGRYVWTVDDPADVPHGPELPVEATLLGSAVFSTSSRPRPPKACAWCSRGRSASSTSPASRSTTSTSRTRSSSWSIPPSRSGIRASPAPA
jgi:hypothetical protein